jgi:hypothetical protein
LRLPHSRERLASFVGGLLRGCMHDAVCRKLLGLLAHLRDAACPWRLDRSSGFWMDVSDVQHLCLPFPVVLWGLDTGNGRRRVMYPPRGNGVVSLAWAEEVMRSPAQLVWDSAHFFPLDAVSEGVPPIIGLLILQSEGLLPGHEAPGLDRTSLSVASGSLGTRGSEAPVRVGSELQTQSVVNLVDAGADAHTPPGDVVERKPGTKWRATRIDEWLVRQAGSSRDLVVRKKCEMVRLAGFKRQRALGSREDRRRRRREDGSWAPGAEAEPPD